MVGQGELGPRALGNRSLLGSPVVSGMKQRMSERIKHREWFRPLAPVMRMERFREVFKTDLASPHMLFSYDAVHANIPEAIHVDGTARIQTLASKDNLQLYELLSEFEKRTGIAALINTSLNQKGRAIAQTSNDVLDDFLDSDVDLFVFGGIMAENPLACTRRSEAERMSQPDKLVT